MYDWCDPMSGPWARAPCFFSEKHHDIEGLADYRELAGTRSRAGRAVLEAGDRVVATARRPEELKVLLEGYGDSSRAVALDVTDAAAARSAVAQAI